MAFRESGEALCPKCHLQYEGYPKDFTKIHFWKTDRSKCNREVALRGERNWLYSLAIRPLQIRSTVFEPSPGQRWKILIQRRKTKPRRAMVLAGEALQSQTKRDLEKAIKIRFLQSKIA